MYVTPGPEIFSLECSHPLEGLLTGLGPLELPEPDPPPTCSLDTARSLTAEGRPLIPSKLPELLNFRLDTLLMRVQRVVPPSSRWSEPRLAGVLEAVDVEEDWTSVGGV